jgi:hypothetical protein
MLTCITGGLWLLSTLFLLCLGCCGSYCCAKATRSRIAIRVVALCLLSHTLSFLLSAFALLRPLRTFALPVAEWCGDACRCRVGPWYLWHAIPLVGASAALLLWRRWARPRHNDKNHAQAQQQHTPLQQPSSMMQRHMHSQRVRLLRQQRPGLQAIAALLWTRTSAHRSIPVSRLRRLSRASGCSCVGSRISNTKQREKICTEHSF